MKSENSKLVLGLVVGAAIGVAVGAFLASSRKEEILSEIGSAVDKARRKIGEAFDHGMEELDTAVDKVNTIAQSAISRAKETRTVS